MTEEKVSDSDKALIEECITETTTWLNDHSHATKTEYEMKQKEIEAKCTPILAKCKKAKEQRQEKARKEKEINRKRRIQQERKQTLEMFESKQRPNKVQRQLERPGVFRENPDGSCLEWTKSQWVTVPSPFVDGKTKSSPLIHEDGQTTSTKDAELITNNK